MSCSSVSGFSPGKDADIGHADDGQPVPAFGAQSSAGPVEADGMRGFARAEIAGEKAVGDDGRALRGNAFVVEGEGSQAGAVLLARIGDDVHQVAAIAKRAQLVEREKRCPREIGFHAQHAVEFDRDGPPIRESASRAGSFPG